MLDVRKAAVRGLGVSGLLKPKDLKRFRTLLGADEGSISVELVFSRDEESRYLVKVSIDANIVVICQRCLEAMPDRLLCENTLAILWTDEEAVHLPKHLDPLVVEATSQSLWEIVEDELILALRPFSYHDIEECKVKTAAFSEPPPQLGTGEGKPNPFKVLGQIKTSEER